ncbi:MAG: tripartite tricarboxylate transporter substrate-binding protein [Xanthobacteraceae bacterium]
MDLLRALCAGVVALVTLGAADAALAQGWPTRAVAVVVPFVSGTTDEFVARIVLGPVSQALGQPFNFENRTGGDGTVGVESVVKANPDGQTLLLSSSAMISAVILHQTLPYDVLHDLEPIAMFGGEPTMLVGAPNKGYASVADLVAAAKAKPGALKYASVGVGSPSYLAGERFRLAAGLDVKHVTYAGPGQALADLNAGRVDFYFIPVLPALPLISEGRAVPLAVSTPHRLQSLRGLPTLDEAGYPIGQYLEWAGLSAPANTPRDVVDKLNGAIVKALDLPAVHSQLLRTGFEPAPMSTDQFAAFVTTDLGAMKKLARDAQIQPLN